MAQSLLGGWTLPERGGGSAEPSHDPPRRFQPSPTPLVVILHATGGQEPEGKAELVHKTLLQGDAEHCDYLPAGKQKDELSSPLTPIFSWRGRLPQFMTPGQRADILPARAQWRMRRDVKGRELCEQNGNRRCCRQENLM
ncbi:hypothetical protein BaRGS_00026696 [Batillaria attramentaria]|uniref:Uncharacterized protein n=1 Tax=Batillaria attramentaria TaxID=370345 RepID=A0ABD0K4V8_9CAEN